jgi:RNA polymerase sigma factor (TIGR02999 family)
MPPPDTDRDLTRLLQRWSQGDQDAVEPLLAASYHQLRRSARGMMRGERAAHTLQATELVHEAFLRLFHGGAVDATSRDAFFRLMAAQMRRHLVDHARRRGARKRGGDVVRADITDIDVLAAAAATADPENPEEYFARLDAALQLLATQHPRAAQVIQERVFADRSIDATAEALGVSAGTVKREYAFGRAWLARNMDDVSPAV